MLNYTRRLCSMQGMSRRCGLNKHTPPRPARTRLWVTRLMSTSATPLSHKFIVYAPDMTDEGALQRRLSVRSEHLVKAREQIARGTISTSPYRTWQS